MKKFLRDIVAGALEKARDDGSLSLTTLPDIVIEEPRDVSMGDFATTIAMGLAKSEKKNPRVIAEAIGEYLKQHSDVVDSVDIAGPGFINLRMTRDFFRNRLASMYEAGDSFAQGKVGEGKKVLVEFVSANPTGPLHVGHGRGAAVGDALARIMKAAGFQVDTEYYVNDVGNQMNNLGRSTWLRYQELMGRSVTFPDDLYQGDYIKEIARTVVEKDGDRHLTDGEEDVLSVFRQVSRENILGGIREDLSEFRVEFNNWFSEQSLYDNHSVDKAVQWLWDRDFIYEKDGATWLKSSAFKDEKDRVIIKQGGERTYFCSDIAYHKNKIERGYDILLNIWGADHHGYVPRMQAVLQAMEYNEDVFKVLLVQFVTLVRGGEKVSMSTRSGEFITLQDVVSEVGVDATRFFFLMRSSDTHLDFDLELAKEESPENPVYYIQYAHARICNIFRTAEEEGVDVSRMSDANLALLVEEEEFSLIKKLLVYPECIEKSALHYEVHRIPYYLQELVALFHGYYSKHRVVTGDHDLSRARLYLLDCLRRVIVSGLDLLGVSAPEKM